MAPTWIETDTNTNVNISSATAVGVYTSTGNKFVMPQLLADQVAGNGDYVYYVTLQVNGAGSAYVIGPKTTHTAAAGETAIGAQGGFIAVRSGDVVTVYIDGLAGDTAIPDVTVRWFELDASANVTMQQGVAVAAADANGNVPVVLYPTQGAVTFGQVKILADVANEGALHVVNSHAGGHGQRNSGGYMGQYNDGGYVGQYNAGDYAGQYNDSSEIGQNNQGDLVGQYNGGPTPVVGAAQQEIADALKRAPAAGTPAVGSVYGLLGDAALEATAQAVLAAAARNGPGTIPWTYTLRSDVDNLTPIPQARIEIWNAANNVLITQAYTDNNGQALFYLDPGTYSVRRSKAGWNFVNPDTETVEEPAP